MRALLLLWGPQILIYRPPVSFMPDAKQRAYMSLKGVKVTITLNKWTLLLLLLISKDKTPTRKELKYNYLTI